MASIALVSLYKYYTAPYLRIAHATTKFLNADEKTQYHALSLTPEYVALKRLFNSLLAHRSKKLSKKQEKLLNLVENIKNEVLTDFKNDEGGTYHAHKSYLQSQEINQLVDKVMNNKATQEDLETFDYNPTALRKTIKNFNRLTYAYVGIITTISFAFSSTIAAPISISLFFTAIAASAACAYIYYSNNEVKIARACNVLFKEYHCQPDEPAVADEASDYPTLSA